MMPYSLRRGYQGDPEGLSLSRNLRRLWLDGIRSSEHAPDDSSEVSMMLMDTVNTLEEYLSPRVVTDAPPVASIVLLDRQLRTQQQQPRTTATVTPGKTTPPEPVRLRTARPPRKVKRSPPKVDPVPDGHRLNGLLDPPAVKENKRGDFVRRPVAPQPTSRRRRRSSFVPHQQALPVAGVMRKTKVVPFNMCLTEEAAQQVESPSSPTTVATRLIQVPMPQTTAREYDRHMRRGLDPAQLRQFLYGEVN
ncbi:hypothetical protein FOZ62_002785 [Perkinsus olseni]|uniref:Uncharacterized protein n=1 Tax=Perkinsus olseni TaxID=32597 RepID=A0A7J6Q915_PEROL|nr:hypothetical protein FOZ62_002785 [Perkinsus olseni]